MQSIINLFRRHLVLSIVLIVVIIIIIGVLVWLINTSRVLLSAKNNPNKSEYSFQLFNQSNNHTDYYKSKVQTIEKTIQKSSYEALISQPNYSYFEVLAASGFFAQSEVSGTLLQENSRSFVGNTPGSCVNLLGLTFISYQCGDPFRKLSVQIPATSTTPTYKLPVTSTNITGNVEGIITTSEGNLALVNTLSTSPQGIAQIINVVDNNLNLISTTRLSDLNPHRTYSIQTFKEGFIAYDSDWKKAYYYKKTKSKPLEIIINQPDSNINIPISITFQGDSVVALYSNNTPSSDVKQNTENKDIKSEVIISGNNPNKFSLDGPYTQAILCGNSKLCLVKNNLLQVSELTNSNLTSIYQINNVVKIAEYGKVILVVNNQGVINVDINSQSGYYSYTFGSYKFNNISTINSGYLLSLTNIKGESVALNINLNQPNLDNIDQKIATLAKNEIIKNISINGTKIFITPNLGELVFNQALQSFTYDRVKAAEASPKINQLIKDVGINTSVYTVINTAPPTNQ